MSFNRIGFRGAMRTPDVIFNTGFQPRNEAAIKFFSGGVHGEHAICFTYRMSAAAYFPLDTSVTDIWIYVFNTNVAGAGDFKDPIFQSKVEVMRAKSSDKVKNKSTQDFSNIHGREVLDTVFHQQNPDDEDSPLRMLYAQEVAVKQINSENILFAIQCKRTWHDQNDWERGGHYRLEGKIIENPRADFSAISTELLQAIRLFLQNELDLSQKNNGFDMPSSLSGFERQNDLPLTEEDKKSIPLLFFDHSELIAYFTDHARDYENKIHSFVELLIERAKNSQIDIQSDELFDQVKNQIKLRGNF